ncbi:MAG: hypothetical protein K5695_01070, partial [Oscillospiraceae bacterium]|nr:hypothetical protein [Oscillospiraceae bacterium]
MKISFKSRILSAVLTCTMLLMTPIGSVRAAAEDTGKYVSEVFIAYGKTEDEAKSWLTSHGWEPVEGNFNAGKVSKLDDDIAAVMGIHRTANASEGITDMAVMNMAGGYSFSDYEDLLKEKRAEINEMVNAFMPAILEFRDNYQGRGSAAGKVRADLAYEILNKIYDGEIDGAYAVNDTGMSLGDLFIAQSKQELGNSAYQALERNEQLRHGDLEQIILEGSAAFVSLTSEVLALAADTNEDTWLERLSDMSHLGTKELAELYAGGSSSLSDSAAESLLMSKFGDAAAKLAEDRYAVQSDLLWYRSYLTAYQLEQGADETPEAYHARISAYFDNLKESNTDRYLAECAHFYTTMSLHEMLFSIAYEGDWGETLGDFFLPAEDAEDPGADVKSFLPFAAAMTDGQRAGLHYLTLTAMLTSCITGEEAAKIAYDIVREKLPEIGTVSVYDGVDRAIFRDCVALTSRARMEAKMGNNPYGQATMETTIYLVGSMIGTVLGLTGAAAGLLLAAPAGFGGLSNAVTHLKEVEHVLDFEKGVVDLAPGAWEQAHKAVTSMRLRLWTGVSMFVISIIICWISFYSFFEWEKHMYEVEFTKIPLKIVDEADIVTYVTDENGDPVLNANGEQKRNINFDQFVYYDVVKCNRPEFQNSEANRESRKEYKEWGCEEAADLNADLGRQWLCLYTTKDPGKGNPILADSLTYQTGSDAMPAGCTKGLHFFTYDYAMDMADMPYAYNSKMNGVYLFWDTDSNAYTASSFTTGQLALAGIGGLAVGILGA